MIRDCVFIHTVVARLFDKTGINSRHQVLVRGNAGIFAKRAPVTKLPEFWRPNCIAQVKVLEKLLNLMCRWLVGLFCCPCGPQLANSLLLALFLPFREPLTGGYM